MHSLYFSQTNLLPRVWCYFDDVAGDADHAYSDSIGVRAAIKEFNAGRSSLDSHLSQAYAFKHVMPESWQQHIYIYHYMNHPAYNTCLSDHKHLLGIN
jgi:hypothetical protein